MSVQGDNSFFPSRVIVLAELSTREKEKYYQMLLNNKAKFHRDEKGRYVASIRLLGPGVKKEVEIKKVLGNNKDSLPLEDRLCRLQQEFVTVKISGVDDFDYTPYNRFSLLIAVNGETVRPKPQSLFWLMKRIEALYDARFVHEKMDVERDDISLGENANLSSIFPVFVVRRFSTEKGLIKSIVDQNCWDLLYNVHTYRHDYLEVEIFARFLQEFYDNDDLLFYLYVRSVIGKVLNVSFKSRWGKAEGPARQPKGLWMSYRECVQVARIVFGATNDTMWKRFLEIISPQMVGQKTETVDSRRIDITQFLHLAVVGYHQTVPPSDGGDGDRSRTSSIGSNAAIMRPIGGYGEMIGPSNTNGQDDYMDGYEAAGFDPDFEEQPNASRNYAWNQSYADSNSPNENDYQYVDGSRGLIGLSESKHDPSAGSYYPASNEADQDVNNDYGSSLDAYLAALSEDVPVDQLLSGSPRKLTLSAPPNTPMYSAPRVDVADEADEYGLPKTQGQSPGAAAAMAAALRAANASGAAVHAARKDSSSPPTKPVVQVMDGENQAFLSISAPALQGLPRLESKAPSAPVGPQAYIDESGQWQEYPDSAEAEVAAPAAAGVRFQQDEPPSWDQPHRAERKIESQADTSVNEEVVESHKPPRRMLESYQSGYGFSDAELAALKAASEADDDDNADKIEGDDEGLAGNAAAGTSVGTGAAGPEADEYAALQLEREREFLSFVCAPLAELPEHISEGMVNELADALRAKLNTHLEGREVSNLDEFDAILLDILQSDELRVEMERNRDDMLQYLFQQMEQGNVESPQ